MSAPALYAKDNGYDSVFAGYGFMAEDDEFVAALEGAGLKFIGPCSGTQRAAGKKDEAKRTALQVNELVFLFPAFFSTFGTGKRQK